MPDKRKLKEGELPDLPARPAGFEPDIPVQGDPLIAKLVWQLSNENPELRRLVKSVNTGPTSGTMLRLRKSGIPQDQLDKTNLMGLFDTELRELYVNPKGNSRDMNQPELNDDYFYNPQILTTLIHEFAHAQGKDEVDARLAQMRQTPAEYKSHMGRALRPTRRRRSQ